MTNLFLPDEFDEWAAGYGKSVWDNSGFPFDGYAQVLQTIFNLSASRPGSTILDLGIGTGNLADYFVKNGCEVWGLDFSSKMLALAQVKIPKAELGLVDLRDPWPPAFQRKFDCIVSAYTFHHFTLDEKLTLVQHLLRDSLEPGGQLVIGDIAFSNKHEEDEFRISMGSEWDQEYYWLADEALKVCNAAHILVRFVKISSCAGIFHFS